MTDRYVDGNAFVKTVNPTVNDDETAGCQVNHLWCNSVLKIAFICTSAAAGAAQWDEIGAGGSSVLSNWHLFYGGQLDFPLDADWDISDAAAGSDDPLNAALPDRFFDDTTQEAVGFSLSVHPGATNIKIREVSRAKTAPSPAKDVARTLHYREIPDDGAVGSWSQHDLTDISMPANANFQVDEQTITLATLSVTAGSLYQWQLSRDTADPGDKLPGDWVLLELGIEFS